MPTRITQSDLLHLRYKPRRKQFQNCSPCPAFKLFDWAIWHPDSKLSTRFRKLRPQTVICLAHPKSIRTLYRLRKLLKNTTVFIAGEDKNLSKLLPSIEPLLPYTRKIYFEAKDIEHSQIESFCMGFISYYLERSAPDTIPNLLNSIRAPQWKKQGILASWGGIWASLDNTLADRQAAVRFVAQCDWIEREELEPSDYWQRLAESQYLLAPAGQGIQSPKLAEAWLMKTIPIVTSNPCFLDLQKEGFPFLILDKWEDLTPDRLKAFETSTRNIDWDQIQSMLTLEHFKTRYLSQQSR